MDFIFDIITLPFDLIGSGIECLFTCLFLAAAVACCVAVVLVFNLV
jgi:hypothetical protein